MSFPSSNSEEPPPLKKMASLLLLQQTTISSLPDDLLLSCLARVSRLYYPTLSLVSKKFRRLIASPELYEARSLLGCTESCLYVCLSVPDPRWFILWLKTNAKKKNKKKTKKKSFGYVLATILIPPSPSAYPGAVVAVGSNIYSIGGCFYSVPSSSVSIIDCRSHTWHEAPSMQAERNFGIANVCDGKIYVAGGCPDKNDSSNWMEVYDPKTQTWETVLCPVAGNCIRYIDRSAVIEGEIFMFGNRKGLAYKPKEDRWTSLGGMTSMDLGWRNCSYCVIDNLLYCYSRLRRGIVWYDSDVGLWVNVIGLKGLPKIPKFSVVKLVCYGGKMVVLWVRDKVSNGGDYKTVWCAVIALEKRNNNQIWGNVESIDKDLFTVSEFCDLECALTVTI